MRRLAAISILFALTAATCIGQARPDAPNILLIMADDLGYEAIAANGALDFETPRLDALAEEGVRFTNAHSTPLCTPTRVQIMTGRYGFRNYREFGYLDPTETTFGHLLQDAGYRTAVAGKWQLQRDANPETPHHLGFDEYLLWQLAPGDYWHRFKHPIVTGSDAPRDTLTGAYGPDVFADWIIDFMDRQQRTRPDEPFFVYYPMVLTHAPFQPPPGTPGFAEHEVVGLNDTTYFADMMRYADGIVGRLVDALDELGIRDETLVIFTGDNGTDRKVQTRTNDSIVAGGKALPIFTGTHVPLIVSRPGTIHPKTTDVLVDFTDVVPTLLDAAGAAASSDLVLDGLSLGPVLYGRDGPVREWVFCDYDGKNGQFPAGRWVHDQRYKLYADGRFFDYRADPLETAPLDTTRLDERERAAMKQLSIVLESVRVAEQRGTHLR